MSPSKSEQEFEAVLEHLKRDRAFDFTGYKRPSLARRIEKRMRVVKVGSFGEYVGYLETHPDEFSALFDTILINVTSFFRDEESWVVVADKVIPDLIARGKAGQIRVWSAGCATGEEAYSLAMLFADALGEDGLEERVKIYATDVDERALNKARSATYAEREVSHVPTRQVKAYFERAGTKYTVRAALRR